MTHVKEDGQRGDSTASDDAGATPSKPTFLGLRETFVLAAIPLIAYALIYAYDAGYLSRYGIPSWVIRLDFAHVVQTSGPVALGCYLLIGLLQVLPVRSFLASVIVVRVLFFPVLCIAIGYWIGIHTAWHADGRAVVPAIVILGCLVAASGSLEEDLLGPLRKHTGKSSWLEKLTAASRERAARPSTNVLGAILDRDGTGTNWRRFVILYLLIAVAHWVLPTAGRLAAKRDEEFTIVRGQYPCVVLRQYGDELLCAAWDSSTRTVRADFQLISLKDLHDELSVRHLGRLQAVADSDDRAILFGGTPKTSDSTAKARR